MPLDTEESLESQLAHICAKVIGTYQKYDVIHPEVTDVDTYTTGGSGYVIRRKGRYYVVTNAHVTEFSVKIHVTFPATGNHKFHMREIGHSEQADTAVLEFVDEASFIERIGPEEYLLEFYPSLHVPVSSDIIVCGYGRLDMMAITHGRILGYGVNDYDNIIGIHAPFVSATNRRAMDILHLGGNSGSPVLYRDRSTLRIIGTLNSGIPGSSKSFLMISEQVAPFVDFVIDNPREGQKTQWITPNLGVIIYPLGETTSRALYSRPTGTEVSYVYPYCDLAKGDFIYGVRVDRVPASSGKSSGSRVARRLLRGGGAEGTYFDIDAYGMVHVPWAIESIPVDWLPGVYPYGTRLIFDLVRDGREMQVTMESQPKPWRPPYYRTSPLPVSIVRGLVATYFCLNQVNAYTMFVPTLLHPRLRKHNQVIISGSAATGPDQTSVFLQLPSIVSHCIRDSQRVEVRKLRDLEGASAIITDCGIFFLDSVSQDASGSDAETGGSAHHKEGRNETSHSTSAKPRRRRRNSHSNRGR